MADDPPGPAKSGCGKGEGSGAKADVGGPDEARGPDAGADEVEEEEEGGGGGSVDGRGRFKLRRPAIDRSRCAASSAVAAPVGVDSVRLRLLESWASVSKWLDS